MITRTKRHTAVAACVAGALVVAGCGTSTDDETASTTAVAVGATAENSAESSGTAQPADDESADDMVADDQPADEAASSADDNSSDTGVEGVANGGEYTGNYTLDNPEFGTMVEVTVADGVRTIQSNALPDHETGEFPNDGNPNTISSQDKTWDFPSEPVWTGDAVWAQEPGVAVNGVKFEPETAESVSCESGENYRVEGLQDMFDLGMDFNNAHVQPTGEYHYHGVSELLADAYASEGDLVHIGFAADGYLMYYSKSGAYRSGYSLTDTARSGTGCTGSGALQNAAVEIDGTTPDGTYVSDWEWNAADGDLDECNGTEINGQYAYLLTDEYPFISRCLNGEFTGRTPPGGGAGAPAGAAPDGAAPDDAPEGAPPGGAPQGAPPGGAAPGGADLTAAAAALSVTEQELQEALGPPPPDLEAAATKLGVTVAELEAVLPAR